MADQSSIEWTNATWNPVTGCDKVSPGCAYCYAETFAERWRGTAGHPFEQGFDLRLWPQRLEKPLHWRKPRMVFVNSMSDLFHEGIPFEFIAAVFGVMASAPRHTFQILTKRPDRMVEFFDWYREEIIETESQYERTLPAIQAASALGVDDLYLDDPADSPWPLPNVWLGVSIESRRFADRADLLRVTPAAVRFISAEPLLGPLVNMPRPVLDLAGIDWLIVGGESAGPEHRRLYPDLAGGQWVRELRDACRDAGTAFFFKQWGGARPGGEALLDGVEHREFPTSAGVPA